MKTYQGWILFFAFAVFGVAEENALREAKFTEVVNEVNVASADQKSVRTAKINDRFAVPEVVKTGADSRAELQADDKTITRVGSNTIFSFDQDKRTINLQSGSVLFHSPKGMGGGTIKTAAATAAVTGTTIMVGATSNGGFKLLVLEGKSRVTMANGRVQNLQGGQMTFIVPGATTPPPVINFRLGSQTEGSKLVGGFEKPLASLPKIQEVTARQEKMIASGKMEPTKLMVGDAKDRKGAQLIDATLIQNRTQASAFEALATYLDRQFQKNFTLFSDVPSVEVFKSAGGATGVYQGELINREGDSFSVFAARNLNIDSGPGLNLGFANGTSTAVLVSQGDMTIMQGVNFLNYGGRLLLKSFQGTIKLPYQPATIQAFTFNGQKMSFESRLEFNPDGGSGRKLHFIGSEVQFVSSQAMNLQGLEFNSTKVFFSGHTVNLDNIYFNSNVQRVDIKTATGQWALVASPIGLTNGKANLNSGSNIGGTVANNLLIGPSTGTGKINGSEIYVSAGGGQ